jgi:hypothetical protein
MAKSATVIAFPDRMAERLRGGLGEQTAPDDQVDDLFGGHEPLGLERLKQQYEDYLDIKAGENGEMAEARRYYHGVQWNRDEIEKLKERNQPVVTYNRIARKINGIVGLIEKLRQDPKAFPRTPNQGAQDAAELATNVLMYSCDVSHFMELSPEASRHCAIGGISGVELVIVQGDKGDPDISLEPLDQREFFYDPRSSKPDFSDARYFGTAKWLDIDQASEQWPDYAEELRDYVERDVRTDTWRGDEREPIFWTNQGQKRLRVVDHWYRRGSAWLYCIYCGEVKLEESKSPFIDEKHQSIPKYWAFSANVDHQNDRYGFFRDLKSPQDEINHRRSKALHLLNTRRVSLERGAVDDVEVMRREVARSDGVVERNKGYELEIDPAVDDYKGNIEMLGEAKAEMDQFGPSAQLMGQQADTKGPQSGRAIALLMQAGVAELGPFILAWRNWKLRVYRALWNAVQQFWTSERWIRVTDDDGLSQFIQVNGWQLDQWGRPVELNKLGALDVDIILDEGPDNINAMADAFDVLVALAQNGAQIPPEAIIELSALPASIKKQVMAKLTQQSQDPMAQQAMQIKLQQEAAKVPKTQSETALNQAKAQQALQPPPAGPGAQVDTPADQAKAALDLANAQRTHVETQHLAMTGPELPSHLQPQPAPPPGKTLQENMLDATKARLQAAQAAKLEAETLDPQRFHPAPRGPAKPP